MLYFRMNIIIHTVLGSGTQSVGPRTASDGAPFLNTTAKNFFKPTEAFIPGRSSLLLLKNLDRRWLSPLFFSAFSITLFTEALGDLLRLGEAHGLLSAVT